MSNSELAAFQRRTHTAPSGCIEWIGPRHPDGYGRFTHQAHQRLAHRAAWELFCGPIPPGGCVLHRCDNPPCCNPEHLFLGDRGDNARDMAAKGRQWIQANPDRRADTLVCPTELRARGSGHGNAKLTEAIVIEIRERASRGELGKSLARIYGVSVSLISGIILGQTWQHAGGPIKPTRKDRRHD